MKELIARIENKGRGLEEGKLHDYGSVIASGLRRVLESVENARGDLRYNRPSGRAGGAKIAKEIESMGKDVQALLDRAMKLRDAYRAANK